MKIACLQFAPQVGEVEYNLTRADAVLSKANQAELDDLDILVLPELSFSGYNYKSLQEISQYLEPAGSGISALWARTIALKYDCNVVLGYPEKVDVTPMWPTSPEYYNSSIVINGDGETVANYRKTFLYYVDEKWALEGKDGFFDSWVSGLGNIAMGLGSDLNPYKLEAPWLAFEFAFHILHVECNLVIVSMAWPTSEDSRHYSRTPAEPDMDALAYWVSRLEPVIRAEKDEEIIVIFANRTGTEGDMTYAGSSAVIGIKGGEVCVYGLLGRGVKELLVVDTELPAFAKLVQRAESDDASADVEAGPIANQSLLLPSRPPAPPPPENIGRPGEANRSRWTPSSAEERKQAQTYPSKRDERGSSDPSSSDVRSTGNIDVHPHAITEERASAASISTCGNPISPRIKALSPRIEIPNSAFHSDPVSTSGTLTSEPVRASEAGSPSVETPTAPSPTPSHMRPKLLLPTTTTEFKHVLTPYPGMGGSCDPIDDEGKESTRARPFIYDGSVTVTTDTLTPSTPYLEFARENFSQDSKFFGMPRNYPHSDSRLDNKATVKATQSAGHMPPRPFRSPGSSNVLQENQERSRKDRTPTPIEPQPPAVVFPTSTANRYRYPMAQAGDNNTSTGRNMASTRDAGDAQIPGTTENLQAREPKALP